MAHDLVPRGLHSPLVFTSSLDIDGPVARLPLVFGAAAAGGAGLPAPAPARPKLGMSESDRMRRRAAAMRGLRNLGARRVVLGHAFGTLRLPGHSPEGRVIQDLMRMLLDLWL